MSILVYEREDLSGVVLSKQSEIVRDRQRPEIFRDENYDKQYDFHTIYYDAFYVEEAKLVRLIGPVLSNLAAYVLSGHVVDVSADSKHVVLPFKIYQKLKVTYLDVDVSNCTKIPSELKFNFGQLGTFQIAVNSDEHKLFAGRRVAFTLFKYEPLEWLRDWMEFNVEYHRADAFLIYQNDSNEFTTEDVAATIADVKGVKAGAAVNWPFPYGPDGSAGEHWESNFCQVGMMAHARWRFLSEAKSVLNGDIDELIVTDDHKSIFELVEGSKCKYIQVPGKWSGYGKGDFHANNKAACRHRHMTHFVEGLGEKPAQPKWAVVPSACPEDSRWIAHNIGRMDGELLEFERAGLRHFRDLNTHWKLRRDSKGEEAFADDRLIEAYKKIGWR